MRVCHPDLIDGGAYALIADGPVFVKRALDAAQHYFSWILASLRLFSQSDCFPSQSYHLLL